MATEPLVPTGTIANTDWNTYALSNIDTDDTTWQDPTDNTVSPGLHLSFATPTGNLTGGATDQVIHVKAREFETGQNGVPTLRIEIWESEGGPALATSSEQNLTASEVDLQFTWDADILTLISGENCEIKLFITQNGGGPNSASGSIQYVEWTASYSVGGTDPFLPYHSHELIKTPLIQT